MQQLNGNIFQNHRLGYCHIYGTARAVVLSLLLFPVCSYGQIFRSPASSSTNTGDAAVGDVTSGKVFSSSTLTNATGTNTKNATVPNDAPIQPPQAFVDCNVVSVLNGLNSSGAINWSNKGITSLDASVGGLIAKLDLVYGNYIGGGLQINLSGNAITDTNEILARLVANNNNGVIDISGGTNAAPTGQGITDKDTLIANGWTVTTN